MVARARRPGYGAPLGDDGRLAEGDDGVLVLQAPVVVERVQPSLPNTATASSASVTVQLLSETNTVGGKSPRSHSADAEFCLETRLLRAWGLTECSEQEWAEPCVSFSGSKGLRQGPMVPHDHGE